VLLKCVASFISVKEVFGLDVVSKEGKESVYPDQFLLFFASSE
jgi:hypothetical protein